MRAMREKCLIISGGEFCPINDVPSGTFIIACDRGYEYALRCGLTPDLVVGDFDSYSGGFADGIPVDRYRVEKDDTDTMIAVRYAVDHGFKSVDLRCALGGRLDHLLANLQSAVFAAEHGLEAEISDSRTFISTMTPGVRRLPKKEGWSLSLFSITDHCVGLSIRGVKYPLDKALITNAFPIGVSNAWKDDEAEIEFEKGILFIVQSKL